MVTAATPESQTQDKCAIRRKYGKILRSIYDLAWRAKIRTLGQLRFSPGVNELARMRDLDIGSVAQLTFAIGDNVEQKLAEAFTGFESQPA